MPLYTPLYLFTGFYMLYKLSSYRDLVAGLVYRRPKLLVLDFSGWFKSVQSVRMSRSDKLKVELFGSRCEAAMDHPPTC